jgi:membrane-associated protease RseP (regulator of RpoE activity)
MDYVFIGLIILFAVLVHEIGHLIAMRKCGVWVNELGIGLPVGPRIGWTFNSKKYSGKTFRVSCYPLLLLGAFVRPEDEKSIAQLSYHDQAFIYGAGVIANLVCIVLGFALLAMFALEHPLRMMNFPLIGKMAVTHALIWGGLFSGGFILWFARPITQYLFPISAVAILVWIITLLLPMSFGVFVENSGGIVAIAQLGKNFSGSAIALTSYGILISYLLAVTNLLPIYPLDGGRIVKLLGEKFFPRIWSVCEKAGVAFFVFLIFFALYGDIRRIIALF